MVLLADCRAENADLTATLDRARTLVSRAEQVGDLWHLDVQVLREVLGVSP